jgi:hypothetical protein
MSSLTMRKEHLIMRHFLFLMSLIISITSVSTAVADMEYHQIEYFWDVSDGNEPLELMFPQFDTQQGTRELIGVSIAFDGLFDVSLWAENLEEYPILSSDWFVESGLFMMFDFDELSIGPVWGGGLGVYSTDLAANDGFPEQGPDYTEWSYLDQMITSETVINQSDFTIFRGEGLLEATLYPYLDLAISAPPPFYDLDVQSHVHFGAITLAYKWRTSDAALLSVDPLPIIAGETTTVTASDMLPNTLTYLAVSTIGPGSAWIPALQMTLDLENPQQLLSAVMSDGAGVASWVSVPPIRLIGRTVWLQAVQDGIKTNALEASIE